MNHTQPHNTPQSPPLKPILPFEVQVRILRHRYTKEELIEILGKYLPESHFLNIIGLAFVELGEFALAEKTFVECLTTDPAFDEPYSNLLSLYIKQSKFELCESVYKLGMVRATKKSGIIFQDGRLAFLKGNYDQSLLAAHTVLVNENFDDEPAIVLAIQSLIALIKEETKENDHLKEARDLWELGMVIFPDSAELQELAAVLTELTPREVHPEMV